MRTFGFLGEAPQPYGREVRWPISTFDHIAKVSVFNWAHEAEPELRL